MSSKLNIFIDNFEMVLKILKKWQNSNDYHNINNNKINNLVEPEEIFFDEDNERELVNNNNKKRGLFIDNKEPEHINKKNKMDTYDKNRVILNDYHSPLSKKNIRYLILSENLNNEGEIPKGFFKDTIIEKVYVPSNFKKSLLELDATLKPSLFLKLEGNINTKFPTNVNILKINSININLPNSLDTLILSSKFNETYEDFQKMVIPNNLKNLIVYGTIKNFINIKFDLPNLSTLVLYNFEGPLNNNLPNNLKNLYLDDCFKHFGDFNPVSKIKNIYLNNSCDFYKQPQLIESKFSNIITKDSKQNNKKRILSIYKN
ncbi:hypothetical protein ACTFIR_009712 [Dictyostelium discoideum]